MKTFALLGNPNCGKTTLFNNLTGSTARVGNWPGVTVDKKEGKYKKLNEEINIIDLPGIYSLSPYTPEEVISRNYILESHPDLIINIVDATNLERNLYLTTQALEIDVPMVIALNMSDMLLKEGIIIDTKLLEDRLNVKVVSISALKSENLDVLMKIAYSESLKERKGYSILENNSLKHLVNDVQIAFEALNVENSLFHAIKLIENDELEIKNHPNLVSIVEKYKQTIKHEVFENDLEAIVCDSRYTFIENQVKGVKNEIYPTDESKNKKRIKDKNGVIYTSSDKIDKVLTNRFLGIPIFLLILFLMFHLTFTENLFFLGGIFESNKVSPSFEGSVFEGLLWTDSGINSPGVILTNLLNVGLDQLTALIENLVSSASPWASDLVVNGIVGGIFAVLGFLPQILVLFLFFSILEDSGYMARVAFILDRIFRKFGLSGRSVLPMIMGFGCSLPAMINTRTLLDEKEKVATIRVIPFFSCGAKLPILASIAGSLVHLFGFSNADIITYSMYVIGITVAIISVILMRNTTLKGEVSPFIMELPTYHIPQFKSLMIHLWDKTKHFVQKAFTIIFASTVVIWFLQSFSWEWKYLPEVVGDETVYHTEQSILASLGMFISPLFAPLGFGSNLPQFGWVFPVAIIAGLIAKENVIMTFGVLAACINSSLGVIDWEAEEVIINGITVTGEVASSMAMALGTSISWPSLIAFIVFNMTTIPCFAAVATAKAELPKNKFKPTLLFWLVTSYIASLVVYLVLLGFKNSVVLGIVAIIIAVLLMVAIAYAIKYINKLKVNKN